MKKSLTITLAVLSLGVLSATLYFTTSSKSAETATSTDTETTQTIASAETTSTETTSILNLDKSDMNSIEVTVGKDSLNYVAGEENWSLEGYEDYALDQAALNYKAKVMLQVEGVRTIKDADLSEYGLDKPSKTATYHLKDGSTKVLSLGNLSLDQTAVYVMLDSQPTTVYVVNSMLYNCMIGDIDSYRTKELESYDASTIHDITISGKDFENISLMLSEEQNGYTTSYNLTTDTLQNVMANTYSVEQLKTALPNFTVNNFVADNVTDLSSYGLDAPTLHLTINYFEPQSTNTNTTTDISDLDIVGQIDYIWGKTLDNGEIAFMKVGDTSVYSMDASFLSNLKEVASPFYLVSKYIAIPNISTVQAIDVVFDDASYHMTVDETNEKYTLADKSIEKDTFKKLYRNLCSLTAEIQLDEASTDTTAIATITYTLSDGNKQVATLTPSTNNQYYQTYINDVLLVGVTKTQVNNLKQTLKAASAGEDFNDIY